MAHIDIILAEHHPGEIRLSVVGDVLSSGAFSERIAVDRADVDRLSERLSRDLLDWANRPARLKPGPPMRETLVQSGLALYQALFGRAGDALRSLKHRWTSGERYCLLHLDEELVHVPVELCHDGDAFLSETFLIGRHVAAASAAQIAPPRAERPSRVLLLANPSDDPCLSHSSEEELREVRKALRETRALDVRPYMGRAIDGCLLDETLPGAAAVHFIGHADNAPDQPERSGWRLSGSRWYGAERVLRLQNPPGIVFANACATARSADWTSSMPLLRAFLERGTQAYIGTWWEVGSPAAARFAAGFYRALARGDTVGLALARARRSVLEALGPDEAAWASYVLYGDPRTRLPAAARVSRKVRRGGTAPALAALALALGILLPSTLADRAVDTDAGTGAEAKPAGGYLTFESEPAGATVRVDGQAVGRTPCTLELDEGTHEVALELAGYRAWEASAVVDPAHPQVVRARLEVSP